MASEVIELLKKDKKAREELSEFIASEIALNPKFRDVLVRTVAGELATKEDIKELRAEIKETEERLRAEIKDSEEKLRTEIKESEERVKSYVDVKFEALNKRIDDLLKVTVTALIAIVVGIVGLFVSKVV